MCRNGDRGDDDDDDDLTVCSVFNKIFVPQGVLSLLVSYFMSLPCACCRVIEGCYLSI